MKNIRLWVVMLGWLFAAVELYAQGIVVNPNGVGVGGAEIGFAFRRRNVAFSFSAGAYSGVGYNYYSFSPYLAGPGQMTILRGGTPFNPPLFAQVTVLPPPVAVLPSPFLPPPGLGFPPVPDIDPRIIDIVARQRAWLDPLPPREGPIFVELGPRPPKPAENQLPGQEAGGFRPVQPGDRDKANKPVPPEKPKADPPNEAPKQLPKPEADPDPKAEARRLIVLGLEAFAQLGYGRATQRFQQALKVDPFNSDGHFLLAQAWFALGKYREAVQEIQTGMGLQPNWPKMIFRPVELYGPNVADYAEHMRFLDAALTAKPNDPDLVFLQAYLLWFDGRRDEALPLFRKAAVLAPNNAVIPLFLNAQGQPMV